jgi:hypothetical protein
MRGSQKVRFPIFLTWIEVHDDKKSARISLDISSLFFHIVLKLVQALVITYDEIFEALAVEGDILLLKPFLDPTPNIVQPRLRPLRLSCVWRTDFHLTILTKLRSRNSFRNRTSPSTARAWKISSYVMTSAWTSLETMWKNRGLMSKDIHMLFLCPLTSVNVKKNTEFYFPTSLHNLITTEAQAVQQLRLLDASFLARGPRFYPRWLQMRFRMDKVAMEQDFLWAVWFSPC